MNEMTVKFDDGSEGVKRWLRVLTSNGTRKTVLEAGARAVTVEARAHFGRRESEPRDNSGFPRFGQSYPRSGFWKGTRGKSVAEKIQAPHYAQIGDEGIVTVAIDSPALAHKADPNPPPIRPKGGRKYLAIPANPLAAAFEGMPRDFKIQGGMKFGFSYTPEGKMMPALVANDNYFRRASRGRKAGQMQLVQTPGANTRHPLSKGGLATEGGGKPLFWLVSKVQTRHDPEALPEQGALEGAAFEAAGGVFARLLK